MNKIYQIAKLTIQENIKRNNFIILFIFIAIVLGSGFLFSMLSPQHEIRVILDLGAASIELFAFLSAAFISIIMISKEIETKTLYLILSRPISRASYLTGRFFGMAAVSFIYIAIMTAALAAMLFLKGWIWDVFLIQIAFFIFLKVLMVIALSLLISLISTSTATSFISIFFLWALGHFSNELKYLASETSGALSFIVDFTYLIAPNFSRLNYKDIFHAAEFDFYTLLNSFAYSSFYSAAILTLAVIIFRKKEL
ncbi:MAG: ABC transporter permease [Elusimicrobiota bacterium]